MIKKYFLLFICILLVFLLFTRKSNKPFYNKITKNDYPDSSVSEFNLFSTNLYGADKPQVFLIKLNGEIYNSWKNLLDLGIDKVEHSKLDRKKNLFVVSQDSKISKLDFTGKLLWEVKGRFHHDLSFSNDQKYVYVLKRDKRYLKYKGESIHILQEYITKLDSKDGTVIEDIPLVLAYQSLISEKKLSDAKEKRRKRFVNSKKDLLHNNSIKIYNCKNISICNDGEVALVSSANINTVSFFHLRKRKVIWSYGNGIFERQHNASYIGNNKILLFDNGNRRKQSRAIIIDINSKKIDWQYPKTLKNNLYSNEIGGAQLLNNGNIQITFGTMGLVKEVNKNGETLWEFNNFRETHSKKNKNFYIYRMERYHNSYFNL